MTRVRRLLHLGHLRSNEAARRSIFRWALRELPTEGGGEMRRASESAGQRNVQSAFIRIAKHRFTLLERSSFAARFRENKRMIRQQMSI